MPTRVGPCRGAPGREEAPRPGNEGAYSGIAWSGALTPTAVIVGLYSPSWALQTRSPNPARMVDSPFSRSLRTVAVPVGAAAQMAGTGARALACAAALAREASARVVLLDAQAVPADWHLWDVAPAAGSPPMRPGAVATAAQELFFGGLDVEVLPVRQVDVASAVVDAACEAGADLLVVGAPVQVGTPTAGAHFARDSRLAVLTQESLPVLVVPEWGGDPYYGASMHACADGRAVAPRRTTLAVGPDLTRTAAQELAAWYGAWRVEPVSTYLLGLPLSCSTGERAAAVSENTGRIRASPRAVQEAEPAPGLVVLYGLERSERARTADRVLSAEGCPVLLCPAAASLTG